MALDTTLRLAGTTHITTHLVHTWNPTGSTQIMAFIGRGIDEAKWPLSSTAIYVVCFKQGGVRD